MTSRLCTVSFACLSLASACAGPSRTRDPAPHGTRDPIPAAPSPATVSEPLHAIAPRPLASVSIGRALHAVSPNGHLAAWLSLFDDGTAASPNVPRWTGGADHVAQVSVSSHHACLLHLDGTVACWGANDHGQLGLGLQDSDRTHAYPVTVPGLSSIAEISVAGDASCARASDGSVLCWGAGVSDVSRPTVVAGVTHAVQVAVGDSTVCVRREDRTVACWGGEHAGSRVATIDGLHDVDEIVVGASFSCARMRAGRVACWGGGYGAIARVVENVGSLVQIAAPGRPPPARGGEALTASQRDAACGLMSNGHIVCWSSDTPAVDQDATLPSSAPHFAAALIAMGAPDEATTVLCAWPASGPGACWSPQTPQSRQAVSLGVEPTNVDVPPTIVSPSLPVFVPAAQGVDADDSFRTYAQSYAATLGGWSIADWGRVALDPHGGPDRFATICEPSDEFADVPPRAAFLIEHAAHTYLFLWAPNNRFDLCSAAVDGDTPPPLHVEWHVRPEHELLAEAGLSGERDNDHVGLRHAQLVRFRWDRLAGPSHGGSSHGNTDDPVPAAVGPDGWLPAERVTGDP